MAKKKTEILKLDLHGVKHKDVEITVENFILWNVNRLPVDIITGHSEEMKSIVIETLEFYEFEYEIGDFFNKGYIHVTK